MWQMHGRRHRHGVIYGHVHAVILDIQGAKQERKQKNSNRKKIISLQALNVQSCLAQSSLFSVQPNSSIESIETSSTASDETFRSLLILSLRGQQTRTTTIVWSRGRSMLQQKQPATISNGNRKKNLFTKVSLIQYYATIIRIFVEATDGRIVGRARPNKQERERERGRPRGRERQQVRKRICNECSKHTSKMLFGESATEVINKDGNIKQFVS